MNTWSHGLRERLAQLEAMGGDQQLAAQAREQIRDGDLAEAETTLAHMELYVKAWLRR